MHNIPENFRGCAMLREADGTLHTCAQGFADWANERPNNIDTRFGTASAGKAFVAVGVMQAEEKGLMTLESTIGEVLDIDWKAIDRDITVAQLLCHTSGIPDYFDESVMEDYEELWADFPNYRVRRNADLLPLFINKPMMYPRGTKFQYNNTGFVVLAMMLEQVTEQAFDDYLRENVFLPAGMADTGYYEMDRLPKNCANAYIRDDARQEFRTNIYSIDAKGTGAGGAFTTVGDVIRLWDALLGGKLVAKELVEQMLTVQATDGEAQYGYGFWLRGNGAAVEFMGSDPGVSFLTRLERKTGRVAALVSNYGDNVWQLMDEIMA